MAWNMAAASSSSLFQWSKNESLFFGQMGNSLPLFSPRSLPPSFGRLFNLANSYTCSCVTARNNSSRWHCILLPLLLASSIGFARRARPPEQSWNGIIDGILDSIRKGTGEKKPGVYCRNRAIKFCHLIYPHPRSSIIVASCAAMRWSLVHIEG